MEALFLAGQAPEGVDMLLFVMKKAGNSLNWE